MNTSPNSTLSEPSGSDRIPIGTLGYLRARNKQRIYSLVVDEFKRSGLSQADLARRLGKNPDIVCRWLAAPGNWTLNTISDFLFAISGAEAVYGRNYPLKQAPRNYTRPEWVDNDWGQSGDIQATATTSSTNVLLVA
jgi:hypothetical protein